MGDAEKLHQPSGQLAQRRRSVNLAPAARTLAFRVRHQRGDIREAQSFGQSLIDPFGRRVEGRMRTINRHARGDQLQQHAAGDGIGRQPLDGRKRQGMVRDDQIRAAADRLVDRRGRDRQTGHQPPHLRLPIADQQTDIVPRLSQPRRGKFFQERMEGFNRGMASIVSHLTYF